MRFVEGAAVGGDVDSHRLCGWGAHELHATRFRDIAIGHNSDRSLACRDCCIDLGSAAVSPQTDCRRRWRPESEDRPPLARPRPIGRKSSSSK